MIGGENLDTCFENEYQKNFSYVIGLAERLRGDNSGNEDLAQEVMFRMLQRSRAYSYPQAKAWLGAVAARMAEGKLDLLSEPYETSMQEYIEDLSSGDDVAGAVDGSVLMEQILGYMTDKQRGVIELLYLQGCNVYNAAIELSIPYSTARTREFHAYKQVRETLGRLGIRSSEEMV